MAAAGTMIRDLHEGTMVSDTLKRRTPEPGRPEPPPAESRTPVPRVPASRAPESAALSGTVAMGTDSTMDVSVGSAHCTNHPSFEATERCDACGKLWCALCNPPVSGERVCRNCKELRKSSGGRKSGRADTPATAG